MNAVLAIDTSSPVLSLALKKDSAPTQEAEIQGYLSHVENLMPMIERMLAENGLTLEQISAFLIGRGPGSFTGLRVGFATVKAFLFLQKKDCYGALSLDMIADNIVANDGDILAVCCDAHRSKIYVRMYERSRSLWVPQGTAEVISPEECAKKIPDGCFMAGSGVTRYRGYFEDQAKTKRLVLAQESSGYPKASSLIRFWENQDAKLQKLETPEDFIPLYLRLSEAEERKTNVHAS